MTLTDFVAYVREGQRGYAKVHEYMLLPPRQFYQIPPGISFTGVILEPLNQFEVQNEGGPQQHAKHPSVRIFVRQQGLGSLQSNSSNQDSHGVDSSSYIFLTYQTVVSIYLCLGLSPFIWCQQIY